jgi:GT2 family glycosyltransferase
MHVNARGYVERMRAAASPCTVVIATFNRRERLLQTLRLLRSLPERPPIIVVDNGSQDDSSASVRSAFPSVQTVRLESNIGAAARNVGARLAQTRYIAFCDDDCWWEPGALARAGDLLDRHVGVALLHARVMVDGRRLDDACALMAASPVPKRSACPGTAIAAFMACAVVVRRSAFLVAGGYHARYHLGAEESLLALELLERNWELIYNPELVLVHAPHEAGRAPRARRVAVTRNRLWTAWLRHSRAGAFAATGRLMREAARNPEALDALLRASVGLPWVLRERRPVQPHVERLIRTITHLPA